MSRSSAHHRLDNLTILPRCPMSSTPASAGWGGPPRTAHRASRDAIQDRPHRALARTARTSRRRIPGRVDRGQAVGDDRALPASAAGSSPFAESQRRGSPRGGPGFVDVDRRAQGDRDRPSIRLGKEPRRPRPGTLASRPRRCDTLCGDSANDREAFRAVDSLGGIALGIGPLSPPNAHYRLPDPAALHAVLREIDESLGSPKTGRGRNPEEYLALYGFWKSTLPV